MNDKGFFTNIGVFFNIAASAYKRSHKTSSESLITIIFSFIGLESFINILAEVASGSLLGLKTPSSIIILGKILNELENIGGSLANKYQVTRLILTGELYDKGSLPYQDFECLIKIRNALIHSKPDKFIVPSQITEASKEYPKFIYHLVNRKIISPPKRGLPFSHWERLVKTPEVAYWSYKTAYEMIISIIEVFPECSLKQILNMFQLSIKAINFK